MLAPRHKEGMDRMHSDLARVTRFVKPLPLEAEALGSAELAEDTSVGLYRAIANPWDEDDFIAVAVQDFDAEELRRNRERVQKMTRGSPYTMCS